MSLIALVFSSLVFTLSLNDRHAISLAVQAGCSVDPVNYFGNEHISSMIQPNKQSKEMEDISKQRLQISLNYNVHQDDADQLASIPNPNPVSTGLRLSYDDDERNSSVTSASGSMAATPSIILSLGDNIRTELDRQQEELDQYVKLQVIYEDCYLFFHFVVMFVGGLLGTNDLCSKYFCSLERYKGLACGLIQ